MKRIVPLFLIGLGIIILLVSIRISLNSPSINGPTPAPLPGSIAGLPLISQRTGQAALAEISRLHGKAFPLTTGAVGEYGPAGQLTIWVSESSSVQLAGDILTAMRDKISEDNSPFTPIALHQIGGKSLYELHGMGQVHYYFQSDNLVIWLAIDENLTGKALDEVLTFYP